MSLYSIPPDVKALFASVKRKKRKLTRWFAPVKGGRQMCVFCGRALSPITGRCVRAVYDEDTGWDHK